jgi:putative glutamine amidotransferase
MPDNIHPLIGITTLRSVHDKVMSHQISDMYVTAIQRVGGIPLLIPSKGPQIDVDNLREKLDGILLSGGADIDPRRFNGSPHPRVYEVDDERDAWRYN